MTSFRGQQPDTLQVRSEADVVVVRRRVRDRAQGIGLDLVTQTKIVTAASELARNTLIHGGGGEVVIDVVSDDSGVRPRTGLRLRFRDEGPGISDVERALAGGWSTGRGLGLGLSGSRRLVALFELDTSSAGTDIVVLVWRRDP